MATSTPARATLRIVPHPAEGMQSFITTEDVRNEQGVIVREKGTRMFRYLVLGTPEELLRYKTARGRYYLEDTNQTTTDALGREIANEYFGSVIYNSREQYLSPRALIFTRKGAVRVADDPFDIRLESTLKKASRFGAGVLRQAESKVADILFAEFEGRAINPSIISQPAVATPQPQNVNSLSAMMQNAEAENQEVPAGSDDEEEGSKPMDEE